VNDRYWYPVCVWCDKQCSYGRGAQLRQKARPRTNPPHDGDCCKWVLDLGKKPRARWEQTREEIVDAKLLRLSGFSTSESDFTPHWNAAFGCRVESLAHMKSLQAKHGTTDMVVKGDGADRHAPRDIARRFKHHRDTADAVASGRPIERDGVSIRVSDSEG